MSGQERVNRMFRRQDQDSVPRNENFWDETVARWRTEGMDIDPNLYLGNDFHGLNWSQAEVYPDRHERIAEDETTETFFNVWGETVKYWKGRSGTPEHHGWPCPDREAWDREVRPLMVNGSPQVNLDSVRNELALARRNGRWAHLTGIETFELTRHLMGDETTMIAMALEPDWVVDVSRVCTDAILRDFQAVADAGIEFDGVWIYGDMAYRRGTLCSPTMYKELVWPDHQRLAQWAHDHSVPFIFHTDGDINGVIDLYIDAGFDCLQPLEVKAQMDVRELAPKYGDRLALFGNVDVMVMGTNDRDLIEAEVRSKLAAGMATRGYAYHSDHSVPPSVSWETFKFIVDLVDQYGNYT